MKQNEAKKAPIKKEKSDINSVKHIQLSLSQEQKSILKRWFGLQRWIYNKCLEKIKNNKITTLKALRSAVINEINYNEHNKWVKEYHYDLRDEALRDLLKNINSNIAKGEIFNIQFKSRKDEYTKNVSMSVLKKHWNKKNNFFSCIFKPSNLKTTEVIPDVLSYDTRLVKTPLNKYYLCIQTKKIIKCENQANMIFIDPGVKTFLTGYDPSGKIITFGCKENTKRIAILLHFKNRLQRQLKLTSSSKNNKLRLALLRINKKIYNLISDLHYKTSKWLCENYKYIYLPRLNFHKLKKLNKKSKTVASKYRHCEFLDMLIEKSKSCEMKILEVNEAYTSKTCSNCGDLHKNLGNKDIYKCESCKVIIGRDINASKNIMLRYFTNRAVVRQPCGLAPELITCC